LVIYQPVQVHKAFGLTHPQSSIFDMAMQHQHYQKHLGAQTFLSWLYHSSLREQV